jgi:hypothetical protein
LQITKFNKPWHETAERTDIVLTPEGELVLILKKTHGLPHVDCHYNPKNPSSKRNKVAVIRLPSPLENVFDYAIQMGWHN